MYFLINQWGSANKDYASLKFMIYTMGGSLGLLLAIQLLGVLFGTFDLPELYERWTTLQATTLLGLPTAMWGLFAYAALAAIAFVRGATSHWSLAWTAALMGVCYSAYLTLVSLVILRSACPYCLTSLALMSATLGLVAWQRPPELAQRTWPRLAPYRSASTPT